jgi:beta-lactamase superfamily II metal-dependent hydrolase
MVQKLGAKSKVFSARNLLFGVATSAVVLGIGGYVWHEQHRPAVLELYIFNLKSGRSMFLRTADDYRLLIDGGSNGDVIRELTKILPFYSRRIDALLATNTEGKNISGLIDVLNRYKVDRVFVPAITLLSLGLASSTDQIYTTFLQTVDQKGIKPESLEKDSIDKLGESTKISILFPVADFTYSTASAPEILFNIQFGTTTISFFGNSSNKVQKYLATSSVEIQSDVVIFGNSTTADQVEPNLLSVLDPDFFVYSKSTSSRIATKSFKNKSKSAEAAKKSTKKNKAVIDVSEILNKIQSFNLKDGSLKIVSDGDRITIEKI